MEEDELFEPSEELLLEPSDDDDSGDLAFERLSFFFHSPPSSL